MKRLVIYATYNAKGVVEQYILYMIGKLKDVAEDLFVVSNGFYQENEKEKLSLATRVYERDDSAFDVGGFAYVINEIINNKEILNYDELILVNDSVFGPFFPLTQVFEKMDKKAPQLDFWGITRRGVSNFDGGDSIYPEHLQIYFYVFKKRLLQSNDFREYWKTILDKVTDFRSAVLNYEFQFTRYFENLGYIWDSYCSCNEFITKQPENNLSPYHYSTYQLIRYNQCPFLKRKLFTGDFIEKKYTDSQDLKRAVEYIDKYTDYNIDMIWDHVLGKYELVDILKAMHMQEIIYTNRNKNAIKSLKIDVIEDNATVCSNYISEECKGSDFLLYTNIFDDVQPYSLRNAYKNNIKENLCDDSVYLASVLELFKRDRRLGVVIPPVNTYGKISKSFEQRWNDSEVFIKIKDKYNLTIPVSLDRAPIHMIKGFICRKDILPKGLLNDMKEDSTGTILQMLPLFAQQKGYYIKTIINEKYVAALLDNIFYIASDIWKKEAEVSEENLSLDEMENAIYKNQIKAFVNKTNKIYVYGAGQLAYRIVKIAKDIVEIAGIVVSDKNGNSEYVYGYKVQSIDEITNINAYIVVAVGKKNNEIISRKLSERGMYHYLLIK